ncbi:MAG: hypothetical protein ABL890_03870 [Candidatus Peribacteraceae bacterium]
MKHLILPLAFVLLSACTPVPGNADYVGMTVTQAETKASTEGAEFRVVMQDGEALPITLDYRPGRINATVEGGIVKSYEIEGEEERKSDYVGMTVTLAEMSAAASGVPFRVVMLDGQPQPATMDYRPGRINATVESDIVTSYEVEGNE